MKRTSCIDLHKMRKNIRRFSLAPLALAVLTGCSPQAEPEENVQFVASLDECKTKTTLTDEQCEATYAQAVKDAESTAPRYQTLADCQSEFGQCSQGSHGFFMPFMAGYIVSNLVDGITDRRDRNNYVPYPVYNYQGAGSYNNRIMTADGHVLGRAGQSSYQVPREVVTPKPKATPTRTLERGGFGSKAAAKNNWGSSSNKSSSSGSSSSKSSSSSGKSSGSSKGGWGG